MSDAIRQLYPVFGEAQPLQGLYLAHDLRQYRQQSGKAYVYANFVTSLDGRIAIADPAHQGTKVPEATANDRDWRLFQELATQADLIISSGRYLRDWGAGRAQEILQVDDPRFADLRAWRRERGLSTQPDIAIVSASLSFPIPDVLTAAARRFIVFTTANPNSDRVAEIEKKGGLVFVAGDEETVYGAQMLDILTDLGYSTVYSAAGPQIHHLLLSGGVLDRLYLTLTPRLLGGVQYATIVSGALFSPPVDLELNALYHDPLALDGLGQLFISYNCLGQASSP
jgi:riboflavin biosynthesis pyrimidine reductase